MSTYSRLLKFGMVSATRPAVYPHMATSKGNILKYDSRTDAFSNVTALSVGNGSTTSAAYSPDGKFLAITASITNGSYYLFKRTSLNGYTAVTLPGTIGGTNYDMRWSPDGKYLLLGMSAAPWIMWWRRNADDTFTAMPAPASLPTSAIYSIAFSQDSKYVAFALYSAPYIAIYKIVSGVLTKINNPATLPGAYAYKIAFLNATTLIYPPQTNTPPICIYSIDPATDAVSLMSTPSVTNQSTRATAVAPDGKHFAIIGGAASDFYRYDGSVFTKLANPAVAPIQYEDVAYSTDGRYMTIVGDTSPYLQVYKLVGDVYTLLNGVPALPSYNTGVTFAPGIAY